MKHYFYQMCKKDNNNDNWSVFLRKLKIVYKRITGQPKVREWTNFCAKLMTNIPLKGQYDLFINVCF